MYQLLALLSGIILAIMISVNGGLSEQYGIFLATVIVHVIGSIFALILCHKKSENLQLFKYKPLWMYLGGAIGVLTTLFHNLAFTKISVTSIIALSLFGQTITSLIVDKFGIFGMQKRVFERTSLAGLLFSILGILALLDNTVSSSIFAVWIAIGSGVTVVLSRSVNTRLSEHIGALRGSLVNHLVGLPITIVIMLVMSSDFSTIELTTNSLNPLIYLGGVLGVLIVYLSNIVVPKIPSFRLTILTFVGQILTGVLLDLLINKTYSAEVMEAGIIIATGIFITIITEHKNTIRKRKREKYLENLRKSEREYQKYLISKHINNKVEEKF